MLNVNTKKKIVAIYMMNCNLDNLKFCLTYDD